MANSRDKKIRQGIEKFKEANPWSPWSMADSTTQFLFDRTPGFEEDNFIRRQMFDRPGYEEYYKSLPTKSPFFFKK